MKNFLFIFIVANFLSVLISCIRGNDDFDVSYSKVNGNSAINLKQVETITLDAGNHLFGKFRESLRVDSSGEILSFADDENQRIYLFNYNGDLINIVGGKGSGPEEFLKISGYFVDNNRVIVVDESQYLVKIFDIDGNLLNSFKLFDKQNLFINSRDIFVRWDTLYLQILEAGKFQEKAGSKLLAKYNLSNGELVGLIGQYEPGIKHSNHYLSFHNFDIDTTRGIVLSALVSSPNIQIFDLKTSERLHHFTYDIPYWSERVEKIEPGMPRQEIMRRATGTSYMLDVWATDSLILTHMQTLTSEWMKISDYLSKENYLAIYNRDGSEYVGSIPLPGSLGDVHEEKLYIIKDFNPDNFKIGVYEIEIN